MSISKKQKTLFESWKCNISEPKCSKTNPVHGAGEALLLNRISSKQSKQIKNDSVIDLCDDLDDDDLLSAAVAVEQMSGPRNSLPPVASDANCTNANGFDLFAGHLWIYPTNYPVREYQLSIAKTALFKNTLVALPTGLGKTFIAAVVLYNYYRWFPQGKVVFMAPTKPLVSQQIEACFKIMGIPMEDQAQITGATMAANRRSELWSSKRVFFATPQVISNDLAKGVCPAELVKCLVIDEAHKALGNHAYCQVVQQLLAYTRDFRVLALSATPGSDLKTVQQVIKNLLISKIELRADDAIDIKRYTHTRYVDKVVVKLTEQIIDLRERYFSVIQIFVNNLVNNNALYNKDVRYLSKYALLMARDQFRKDPPSGLPRTVLGTLEGTFAILISLYHGLELLLQHGMKSFFIFLKGMMDGSKGSVRSKTMLSENPNFCSIFEELTRCYGEKPDSVVLCTQKGGTQHSSKRPHLNTSCSEPYVYSHPKMEKLEQIVIQHFQDCADGGSSGHETRVMIFCQYRDIVREITELLQRHRPLIRPMQFVGHAPSTNPNEEEKSGAKSSRRFTQKDQLMVVNKFRSGDYNTLVSTCVGEEGLDIGDVDLIVCYDSHKSPIRLVQRMGRTGRKRKGRIVMLVTEGKEERDYNSSLASRRSIHKAILGAGNKLQYYPHNPAMIPPGAQPKCHKMFITVPENETTEPKTTKKKTKEKKIEQPDVSAMLTKKAKSCRLSEKQREEYSTKFMLSFGEQKLLKQMPSKKQFGKCIHIEKELWGENYQASNSKALSLTEWLPWQSRLQPTKYVEHSSKTKMFTEVLQFCDTVRERSSTQLGYTDVSLPHDQVYISSKLQGNKREATSHKPIKTGLNKLTKKKTRKPLIVLSDDEDYLLPDDFQDLPAFDPKTLTSEISSISTLLSDENKESDHGSASESSKLPPLPCEETDSKRNLNSSSITLVDESSSQNVSNDNVTDFVFKESPLSSNLSALSFSPEHEIETGKTVKTEFKVSKSKLDIFVNVSTAPMDSINFDDLSNTSTSKKTVSQLKPKCFQLSDSDNGKTCDFAIIKRSLRKVFESENEPQNKSTLLSLLEDTVDNHIAKQASKQESPHASCTSAMFKKPAQCSKTALLPTTATKGLNSSALTKNTKSSLFPDPTEEKAASFDVSADMFTPDFDLNFDLGFDTFDCDETKSACDQKLSNYSGDQNDASDLDNGVFKHSTSNKSVSAKEKTTPSCSTTTFDSKMGTQLSPASSNSFSLSQTKRLENQKLFSEFNFSEAHSPPCAKVLPQVQTSRATVEESCPIIASSPVQEKPAFGRGNRKHNTRKRASPFATKEDCHCSDDEFQCIDSIAMLGIKKPRRSDIFKEELLDQNEDSLSDEEFSAHDELPFKKSYSNDAGFLNESKSPVLSLTTKKKHKKDSSTTPVCKVDQSRFIDSARHSTPKTDISQEVVKSSESDFADESIIRRNCVQKKRPSRRNMFICDEADVSEQGEEDSSDEEVNDDQLAEEMKDFVNDATQLTQLATQKSNERALYLRSLSNLPSTQQRASTEILGGKYKLAYGAGADIDVFSQVPDKDISDYMNDSFCVQNDEVLETSEYGEVTLLESPVNIDSKCRPKTRAQARLKEVHSPKPVKVKPRRRLVIFDDENNSDSMHDSNENVTSDHGVPSEPFCRRIVDASSTPTRFCELCNSVVKNLGWLCKNCIAVMKKSESDYQGDAPTTSKQEEKTYEKTENIYKKNANISSRNLFESKEHDKAPITLTLTKEDRLKRSKLRQAELRNKLKLKRSSFDSTEATPHTSTSSLSATSNVSPIRSSDNTKLSSACSTSLVATSSATPRKREGKLTIFIDNRELSANAVQLAQALRTAHNVNVQVVSLKCCSCVVSRRCAVIRRMVDDITNTTKKQKLALTIKQARQYYDKLFIIIEKNKVKKGWINTRPSSAHSNRVTAALLTLAQGGLQVLHSESQENSAEILHLLAEREQAEGQSIDEKVLRNVTDKKQCLFNIYLSFPGVSYTHALYMCHRFKSLKQMVNSSLTTLTTDIQLHMNAARNLQNFLRKKFDVQMTPL